MKFCYFDESGKGSEPVLAMAGILVDSHRMHRTKEAWQSFLRGLSVTLKTEVKEFHSKDF